MGNAARKARKRAGIPFVKAQKVSSRAHGMKRSSLGLVSGAEILAALVVRGIA